MKILSLLLLATSLLFTFNASQDSPELEEAATLATSASKLLDDGKYDDAVVPAKRALQIREKLLPANDIRVSASLSTLGKIYYSKRDYKASREVFQRLLQNQEQNLGPDNVRIAETLDWLAALQHQAGKPDDAEASYKRALALREKNFGSNHERVARSLSALAEFYRARREWQSAVDHYRRALTLYAQILDSKNADFIRVSDGFYCAAYESNNPELAKEINEIWKQAKGGGEPEAGTILNGRALSLPIPNYPAAARAHRLSGTIIVKVFVDEAGNVTSAKDMCNGPQYLSEAAVAAAMKARFTTTKLSGMPVKNYGVIFYNFVPR
jgi:TonB family protein